MCRAMWVGLTRPAPAPRLRRRCGVLLQGLIIRGTGSIPAGSSVPLAPGGWEREARAHTVGRVRRGARRGAGGAARARRVRVFVAVSRGGVCALGVCSQLRAQRRAAAQGRGQRRARAYVYVCMYVRDLGLRFLSHIFNLAFGCVARIGSPAPRGAAAGAGGCALGCIRP